LTINSNLLLTVVSKRYFWSKTFCF